MILNYELRTEDSKQIHDQLHQGVTCQFTGGTDSALSKYAAICLIIVVKWWNKNYIKAK